MAFTPNFMKFGQAVKALVGWMRENTRAYGSMETNASCQNWWQRWHTVGITGRIPPN
jgi:hypothetical protein